MYLHLESSEILLAVPSVWQKWDANQTWDQNRMQRELLKQIRRMNLNLGIHVIYWKLNILEISDSETQAEFGPSLAKFVNLLVITR